MVHMKDIPDKYKEKDGSLTVRIPESAKEKFARIGYGNYSRGVLLALEYYEQNQVIPNTEEE